MNDNLINILNEKLLKASLQKGWPLFDSIVDAIRETTNCRMCSLWSINTNNTNGGFKSASIIVRKLEAGIEYPTNDNVDFAHKLDDCYIQYILGKTKPTEKLYYCCPLSECDKHKSKKALEILNLKYFINIPIRQDKETTALLKLSFVEDPQINQPELLLFATTIHNVISSCFFRYMLYQKHQIMEKLVTNYQRNGADRNLKNIFNPILENILKEYCKYEGASIFIWDSYNNYYKLLSTTGINENNDREVCYTIDEGYTGKIAKERKSMIYDDLEWAELYDQENYKHKFREKTELPGKTMMVIPIFRPSKKDEVIGILRFVNKQNNINPNVIDYFNDADEDIMSYASKYLALTIDYFLGEEERNNFLSKLSHEFRTPANTIRITADRLIKNKDNNFFIERCFDSYMESILFHSELQIQQATTNLYVSKTRINIPKAQRYSPAKNSFKDIVYKGKTTVIPIAREIKLTFDNIIIEQNNIDWDLFIDDFAFVTVFYNLLTNTIKYRNNNFDFYVNISGYQTDDYFIITISDYGIGIEEKDRNKIFHIGVRGENAVKKNANGFGIGLPVIKQIINDFGGEISVSNLKSPTKFEIKLPKYLSNNNYIQTEEWNSK